MAKENKAIEKSIIGYVNEFGRFSYEDRPFCKEDALVLCQTAYLKFDTLLPTANENLMSIKEMKKSEDYESLYADFRYEKDNRALFEAMVKSKRFGDLKACYYINRIESDIGTQFAAITYIQKGMEPFIAFRGTDENIVGWQEDFKLSLDRPISGQKLSAKYINDVATRMGCSFNVGGHSKGGNLSLYASMNCTEKIKRRIQTIYSFDAPGFRPEVLSEYGYDKIKKRVVSVIPKSSLVGMLLACDDDSLVVEAREFGVHQHNPYNWVIEDGHMLLTELKENHRVLLSSINEWMLSLSMEELERFVDYCQFALGSAGAETTLEFSKEKLKYLTTVIKNSKDVDENTKKFLQGVIKAFLDIAYEKVKDEVTKGFERFAGK